jgi:hypothetical protein
MPTLYDSETRKPLDLRNIEDADQGVIEGRYSYQQGDLVEMRRGDDFTRIAAEELRPAIEDGWRIEMPGQKAVRTFMAQPENQGLSGAAKVFVDSAADELSMGVRDIVRRHSGNQIEQYRLEAMRNEHELANAIGSILGFGGSLVYGGPLWKGAQKAGAKVGEGLGRQIFDRTGKDKFVEAVGKKGELIARARKDPRFTPAVAREASKSMARTIVERGGAGMVEGALSMSPRIGTEMFYGDMDAAGEHLLWAAGTGGILGPFLGARTPESTTWKKLAKQVQRDMTKEGEVFSRQAKTLHTITGAKAEDWQHYLTDWKAIQERLGGRHHKQVRDEVVQDLGTVYGVMDDTQRALKNEGTWVEGETGYIASQLADAMEAEKAATSMLSGRAFDILDESGQVYAKSDIQNLFQKELGKHTFKGKQSANPDKVAAFNKISDFLRLMDEIPGNILRMRDIKTLIQDLDSNIQWRDVGQRVSNRELNNSMIAVRRKLNDDLRQRVTGYAEIMDPLNQKMRALNKFGDEFITKKGIQDAAIKKVGSPSAADAKRRAWEDFLAETRKQFDIDDLGTLQVTPVQGLEEIAETIARKNEAATLLQRGPDNLGDIFEQYQRLSPKQLMGQLNKIGTLNDDNRTIYALLDGIDAGMDGDLLKTIKNAAESGRFPELNLMAEALEGFSLKNAQRGASFSDTMRDVNVIRRITAPRPQGSRKTLLNALGGYMIAPPGMEKVATFVAAAMGAASDITLGSAVKALADSFAIPRNGMQWVEKRLAGFAKSLDEINDSITGKKFDVTGRRNVARQYARQSLYRMLLPEVEHSNDPGVRLENIRNKLQEIIDDPRLFMDYIEEMTFGVREGGAPEMAEIAGAKSVQVAQYLLDELPKAPEINAFGRKQKWRPSGAAMKAWEDKAMVALDPSIVKELFITGGLNRNHMKALRTMYPEIAGAITRSIYEGAAHTDLNYQQRIKISLITGTQLDKSMQNVAYYQETYVPPEEREQKADFTQGGMDAIAGGAETGGQAMEAGLNPDAGVDMSDLQVPPEVAQLPPPVEPTAQVAGTGAVPPINDQEFFNPEPPLPPLPQADIPVLPGRPPLPGAPGAEQVAPPMVPADLPTPLPLGKEIMAFIDLFTMMEETGVDPGEAFPEDQVSPEQRQAFDAAMAIYPKLPGRLVKVDFKKGEKVPDELDKELSDMADEIYLKKDRTATEEAFLKKYDAKVKAGDEKERQRMLEEAKEYFSEEDMELMQDYNFKEIANLLERRKLLAEANKPKPRPGFKDELLPSGKMEYEDDNSRILRIMKQEDRGKVQLGGDDENFLRQIAEDIDHPDRDEMDRAIQILRSNNLPYQDVVKFDGDPQYVPKLHRVEYLLDNIKNLNKRDLSELQDIVDSGMWDKEVEDIATEILTEWNRKK